jgi:hypothetical protein
MLTHKGVESLLRVERLMDDANRILTGAAPAAQAAPAAAAAKPATATKPAAPATRAPGRADNKVGSVAAN